jgi:hypothetical protein
MGSKPAKLCLLQFAHVSLPALCIKEREREVLEKMRFEKIILHLVFLSIQGAPYHGGLFQQSTAVIFQVLPIS